MDGRNPQRVRDSVICSFISDLKELSLIFPFFVVHRGTETLTKLAKTFCPYIPFDLSLYCVLDLYFLNVYFKQMQHK